LTDAPEALWRAGAVQEVKAAGDRQACLPDRISRLSALEQAQAARE